MPGITKQSSMHLKQIQLIQIICELTQKNYVTWYGFSKYIGLQEGGEISFGLNN